MLRHPHILKYFQSQVNVGLFSDFLLFPSPSSALGEPLPREQTSVFDHKFCKFRKKKVVSLWPAKQFISFSQFIQQTSVFGHYKADVIYRQLPMIHKCVHTGNISNRIIHFIDFLSMERKTVLKRGYIHYSVTVTPLTSSRN